MSSWTAASSDCSRPVNNYVHVKTADLYRPNARLTPERQGYQVLTPFGKLGYSLKVEEHESHQVLRSCDTPWVSERRLMLLESLVKATVELQGFRVMAVTGDAGGLVAECWDAPEMEWSPGLQRRLCASSSSATQAPLRCRCARSVCD